MKSGWINSSSAAGFSLIEVMVALTVFAVFIISFATSESSNLRNSRLMREELQLHVLAERVVNEVKLDPPKFDKALTLAPVVKKFEEDHLEDFEYQLDFLELEVPDWELLSASEGSSQEQDQQQTSAQQGVVKQFYRQLRQYVQERIWQLKVTIRHKVTGEEYVLSTWLENTRAQAQLNL